MRLPGKNRAGAHRRARAAQVTYRRLRETLAALGRAAAAGGPAAPLLGVLFGAAQPRFLDAPPAWTPRNAGLDAASAPRLAARWPPRTSHWCTGPQVSPQAWSASSWLHLSLHSLTVMPDTVHSRVLGPFKV